MSVKPGRVVGKMLWLVPRYTEKSGTLMKLGTILSDAEDLESSLNTNAIPAIPEAARRDATSHVRQYVRTELSDSNSLLAKAVPTLPIFSAGASAEGCWSHSAETTVEAMNVKAEVFIPDKRFMQDGLKHEGVIEYARQGWSKPLYVIVGVATASRLSLKEKQEDGRRIAASASVRSPGLGEGEIGAEHEKKGLMESQLAVGEACDFAYRVREFVFSRVRGLKDKGNRGDSAMFGRLSEGGRPVTETEDFPQFLYLEDEDVAASSSDKIVALAVSEETVLGGRVSTI